MTASQIAEGVHIPKREAAIILNLLRHLGNFWNGGGGDESGTTSINIDYEEVKREYLRYKGVDILIANLYKDRGVDEYGRAHA